MPSVHRRKRSPFWYAVVRHPDGTVRHFSTGMTDRAEALAVAVAAERETRRHAGKPHQLRAALARLADDFVPREAEDPAGWLRAWAKRKEGEVAPSTGQAYTATMAEAARWMEENRIRAFAALSVIELTRLRDHWATVSPVSANKKIKHLRIAMEDAVRERRIEDNPAAGVPRLREARTARRNFSRAELAKLLPALSGEWRGVTMLGLATGQRLNDLAALRRGMLDLSAKSVTFRAGKTGALVSLPLMPAAVDALAPLVGALGPEDLVFPAIAAMAPSSRSNAFRDILTRLGLATSRRRKGKGKPGGGRTTSELSFHSLRHTTTTLLKAAGVADSVARAIVGHESKAVSASYTHLDLETIRSAMSKVDLLREP